ncbi:hypothetical protein CRUP_023865 [Coryphaenoides rupestris]|nr:hypothetical protein CRUP_023865 [Coryphaenoides rupestris]
MLIEPSAAETGDLQPCNETDYSFEYTECDSTGSRWRVAIPRSPGSCSPLPPPARGMDCFPGDVHAAVHPVCGRLLFAGQRPALRPMGHHTGGLHQLGQLHGARTPRGGGAGLHQSNRDDCTVSLIYAVHLEKQGSVAFTYQYPDNNIFFEFYVNLKSGTNILYWRTTGILVGRKMVKPVLLRSIQIEGVAYTSECFPCRPGWFSAAGGSSSCTPCPRNTSSGKGASDCTPCPPHHYARTHRPPPPPPGHQSTSQSSQSPPVSPVSHHQATREGWAECKPRPPCSEEDYFQIHTACDSEGKTQVTYRWVEPKICVGQEEKEGGAGVVSLPPSGAREPCPPSCAPCPASTEPVLGYEYKWWNVLPPNMKTSCFNVGNSKWEGGGDHVPQGARGHDNDYPHPQHCGVPGVQDVNRKSTTVVESWEGSQKRQTYTHIMTRNASVSFTWAFQRTSQALDARTSLCGRHGEALLRQRDQRGGGRGLVLPRLRPGLPGPGAESGPGPGGLPPPPPACRAPPASTSTRAPTGVTSAPPAPTWRAATPTAKRPACPVGRPAAVTRSTLSATAIAPSPWRRPTTNNNNRSLTFDLRALSAVASLSNGPSFTSKGTKYLHLFNLSLCGHQGKRLAVCSDNVTDLSAREDPAGDPGQFANSVHSFICQSTIIPADGRGFRTALSSQSISLADSFLGATVDSVLSGVNAQPQLFPKRPSDIPDINFFYRSSQATASCDQGRSSVVTVRCNPGKPESGELSVPRSSAPCEAVALWLKVGLGGGAFAAVLLVSLTCYFWKKNKRLEYKYSRLVMSANREGELPGADSCALAEGRSLRTTWSTPRSPPCWGSSGPSPTSWPPGGAAGS